jgi:multicomponent K+:H+ antiporter subunit E
MKRFFPRPVLSAIIFLLWLALSNASSFAHGVLALILATVLPLMTNHFWSHNPPAVRLIPSIQLLGVVLWDIVMACIEVAILVLGPVRRIKPTFIEVPLDLRDPYVGTILASIVSLTPGTVSIDIDRERWVLQIHSLNVDDVDSMVRIIKTRYEQPLREIFSC